MKWEHPIFESSTLCGRVRTGPGAPRAPPSAAPAGAVPLRRGIPGPPAAAAGGPAAACASGRPGPGPSAGRVSVRRWSDPSGQGPDVGPALMRRGRRRARSVERSCHEGGGCPPRRMARRGPSGASLAPVAPSRGLPARVPGRRPRGRPRAPAKTGPASRPPAGRRRADRNAGAPAAAARARLAAHPPGCQESVERQLSNIGCCQ